MSKKSRVFWHILNYQLAQAAMTDGIDREDELAIGVAVFFQDVIDVFQEIRNHLEMASNSL